VRVQQAVFTINLDIPAQVMRHLRTASSHSIFAQHLRTASSHSIFAQHLRTASSHIIFAILVRSFPAAEGHSRVLFALSFASLLPSSHLHWCFYRVWSVCQWR
jgi:hypothetical protein